MGTALIAAAVSAVAAALAVATAQVPEPCRRYQRLLTAEAQAVIGLDAPLALLGAQIEQESSCQPHVASPAGAQGLAQFMPATAADMAARYPRELGPADPLDWRWAIRAQVRYMHELTRKPWLTRCDTWSGGLSSYNGGMGWVARDRARCMAEQVAAPNGQRVPCHAWRWQFNVAATPDARRAPANIRENRDYVTRIVRAEERYLRAGYPGPVCRGNQK